jgi:tetratricopeptide (TPR) repeat protein
VSDRRAAILQFNAGSEQAVLAREGKGDFNLAFQLHASSVMNDPDFGLGWHELGNDLGDMQNSAAAAAAHRRALELPDGDLPGDMSAAFRAKSLIQLAYRLHVLGHNAEARAHIDRAMEMDAKIAQAWCVLSLINSIEGKHDAAIAASARGLELEPDNATIKTAHALNLLFAGKLRAGLQNFEARFAYKLKHFLNFPYPQWHGEEGKTVYLVADQGLGDTISFARFVRDAVSRCKFVYIGVQKELIRLFKASFQDIPNIDVFTPNAVGWPPADCWSTFVSLPTALDLPENEIRARRQIAIPNFSPTSLSWRAEGRRLHIGVAWRGSTASDIDHHRSFPVEHLLTLYKIPGIQLYSLQADQRGDELHHAGCGALIRDLRPFIGDVADTCAIIRHLDMIVTVESALGHIAGACGARTIIPYSALGHDYRLGRKGENIIWYPRHSVVQQRQGEGWDPTFHRVVRAIEEELRVRL